MSVSGGAPRFDAHAADRAARALGLSRCAPDVSREPWRRGPRPAAAAATAAAAANAARGRELLGLAALALVGVGRRRVVGGERRAGEGWDGVLVKVVVVCAGVCHVCTLHTLHTCGVPAWMNCEVAVPGVGGTVAIAV